MQRIERYASSNNLAKNLKVRCKCKHSKYILWNFKISKFLFYPQNFFSLVKNHYFCLNVMYKYVVYTLYISIKYKFLNVES